MTHPGPSHPGPSGPSQPSSPSRGHLPIAPAADYEWNFTRPSAPTPRLGEVVRDAERLAAQLVSVLARQYDPESAPAATWAGTSTPLVDLHLGCAVDLVRQAVAELQAITDLQLPPVGSAVRAVCPGKTLGDGVPAPMCGDAAVHGQHPLSTSERRDLANAGAVATPGDPVGASRARSGGPGTTVPTAGRGRAA